MKPIYCLILLAIIAASCASATDIPTSTATIVPTPASSVDPCLTTAKTYKPGSLPPARIAFHCYTDANRIINIYVFDTTTGRITNFTNYASLNLDIQWSPDGKKIAFTSTRNDGAGIYVMNTDGGQATWLAEHREPRWSPDGKRIAFVRDYGSYDEVYVMNADGSQQIRLTNNSTSKYHLVWSPDGKQIAFNSYPGGIYVMNSDGSQQTNLTDHPSDDGDPAWSPDGKHILFLSTRDDTLGIYKMKVDGSQVTKLTSVSHFNGFFAWSPDSRQIVIACTDKVYIMNADGTQLRPLVNERSNHLSWSPDGEYLTSDFGQLYIVEVGDGQLTQLTDGPAFKDYPAWSPK